MYDLFERFVNQVYLTEVFADVRGDSFFNMKFPNRQWRTIQEDDFSKNDGIDDYGYRFSVKNRIDRKYRYKFVSDFLTELDFRNEWIKNNISNSRTIIDKYVSENLVLDI